MENTKSWLPYACTMRKTAADLTTDEAIALMRMARAYSLRADKLGNILNDALNSEEQKMDSETPSEYIFDRGAIYGN